MAKKAAVLVLLLCAALTPRSQERVSPQSNTVHAEMHNVLYHFTDSVSVLPETDLSAELKRGLAFVRKQSREHKKKVA